MTRNRLYRLFERILLDFTTRYGDAIDLDHRVAAVNDAITVLGLEFDLTNKRNLLVAAVIDAARGQAAGDKKCGWTVSALHDAFRALDAFDAKLAAEDPPDLLEHVNGLVQAAAGDAAAELAAMAVDPSLSGTGRRLAGRLAATLDPPVRHRMNSHVAAVLAVPVKPTADTEPPPPRPTCVAEVQRDEVETCGRTSQEGTPFCVIHAGASPRQNRCCRCGWGMTGPWDGASLCTSCGGEDGPPEVAGGGEPLVHVTRLVTAALGELERAPEVRETDRAAAWLRHAERRLRDLAVTRDADAAVADAAEQLGPRRR